jgi:hypothetical protein
MSKKTSSTSAKEVNHPNSSFDVLKFSYGKATNVAEFKETAFEYNLRVLGAVAHVIKTGTRFVPKPVPGINDPNAFTAANDPHGFKQAAAQKQITQREGVIMSLQEKEYLLWGALWSNISKESRSQIESATLQAMDDDGNLLWVDVNGVDCPANQVGAKPKPDIFTDSFGSDCVSLMRRINMTHLSPDSGVKGVDQELTHMRFERLSMSKDENLLEYKRRFEHALAAMKAIGLPDVPQDKQAVRFILNLDQSKYTFRTGRLLV